MAALWLVCSGMAVLRRTGWRACVAACELVWQQDSVHLILLLRRAVFPVVMYRWLHPSPHPAADAFSCREGLPFSFLGDSMVAVCLSRSPCVVPLPCFFLLSGWCVVAPPSVAMAKSKNHTAHNQSYKAHRNGIKRPARNYHPSRKGVRAARFCGLFVVAVLPYADCLI